MVSATNPSPPFPRTSFPSFVDPIRSLFGPNVVAPPPVVEILWLGFFCSCIGRFVRFQWRNFSALLVVASTTFDFLVLAPKDLTVGGM
jgi:hypothetical protein